MALVAACGVALATPPSFAQPNLPPPPPPPIGEPTIPSLPLPPPPPARSPSSRLPAPRRTNPAPPPPVPYRPSPGSRDTDEVVVYVEPQARPVAVTLNPMGLYWGRLSANVEVQLAPHHSILVSPNALLFHASRGGPNDLVSEGLGFASNTSGSFGIELGYHYWWRWSRALRGPFFGPALLLGSTTAANVGDPARAQSYGGLAVDFGWQEVLPGGFTAGAGGGLEWVDMAGTGAIVPRLLLQLGWSF